MASNSKPPLMGLRRIEKPAAAGKCCHRQPRGLQQAAQRLADAFLVVNDGVPWTVTTHQGWAT